ncbi:hypothetical protein H5410_026296 [Solanum commersonii]|uniref:DUF4283 domain-containing protein n=1 Tax=Solanum commersonii TaxID=4109 RepID=A0A9J5Z0C2_SOLCO|nr:hypothetical protein H5410_026296 [Solanum commersonii]
MALRTVLGHFLATSLLTGFDEPLFFFFGITYVALIPYLYLIKFNVLLIKEPSKNLLIQLLGRGILASSLSCLSAGNAHQFLLSDLDVFRDELQANKEIFWAYRMHFTSKRVVIQRGLQDFLLTTRSKYSTFVGSGTPNVEIESLANGCVASVYSTIHEVDGTLGGRLQSGLFLSLGIIPSSATGRIPLPRGQHLPSPIQNHIPFCLSSRRFRFHIGKWSRKTQATAAYRNGYRAAGEDAPAVGPGPFDTKFQQLQTPIGHFTRIFRQFLRNCAALRRSKSQFRKRNRTGHEKLYPWTNLKSPQTRCHIRTTSGGIKEVSTIKESSPELGVHPTEISTILNGEIASHTNSGHVAGAPINNGDEAGDRKTQCDKDNNLEVTIPTTQQENNTCISSNLQGKATAQSEEQNREEELESLKMVEVMYQEQMTRSTKAITDYNVQRNLQVDQSAATKQNQVKNSPKNNEQAGTSMDKQHRNREKSIWQVMDKTNSKDNTTHNARKEEKINKTTAAWSNQNENENGELLVQATREGGATQHGKNIRNHHNQMNSKIPPPIKISSNFDVYRPVQQKTNQNNLEQTLKKTPVNNFVNENNNHQIPDPAPPTVTQSLATRLRANQLKNATPMTIDQPIITTRQGYPSITFYEEDFLGKMSGRCKYTLVGKFINAMPKMEAIRKSFIAQTQLTGGVKIAYFNSRHIYIDLDNEADHISVSVDEATNVDSTFKPAEETPIVPIWITLPELPWHCHYMDILTPLLSPIGKALYLDSATMQKTRGSVAKVRVQIDITKERPQHVWLGFSEKDPNLGKWQIIEYEDVPPYCIYCKHQGHVIGECPQKEKDEVIKKNKDQEAAKKIKEKQNIQNPKGVQPQTQTKENMPPYQQATDSKQAEKNTTNKEELWQVQTKKKNKHHQQNQEQGKNLYPQVQKQQTNSIKEQHKLQQSGMASNNPMNVNEKSGDQISTPQSPVIVDVDDHCDDNDIPTPVSPLVVAAEVIGGRLDVQEKTLNLQERDPRGRVGNHAPATTPIDTIQHQEKFQQNREKSQDTPNQQVHISKGGNNQPEGSMAKNMGNKANEYEVDNSEDDFDADKLQIKDQDMDDEISEALIKAFNPNNDNSLEEEVQQVTNKQGLSPRGIHLDKLPLKKTCFFDSCDSRKTKY